MVHAILTLAVVAAIASQPARAETVLRWASVGGALTFDPHSLDETPTIAQHVQVYERLLELDAPLELVPQLAVAWRLVDPLTWEFELREGVRFHDGTPFSAADVVFSLERARTEPSQLVYYFANVGDIRAVDAHTVHVTTPTPAPLLPVELRGVPIMSKAWAEAHGATVAADFKAGERTYATHHANGTGPFLLETFAPGGRIVMRRNPDWWGYERYPLNVDRIVYTPLADPGERLAALLGGELDLLTDVPFEALDRIQRTPGLKLEPAPELRTIFLGLDQTRTELRSSDVRGRNPFKDKRVRRALYQAIDIQAIRKDIMRGLGVPAGMLVPPGVNGHSPDLDRRLPYDPARARELLAEAGYPDGFKIRLDCPNNRYINDEAICRAVAAQLGAIGIEVTVDAQPKDRHFQKINNRETDFYMHGWGFGTLDAQEFFLPFLHSRGGLWSVPGYANPRVDELIEAIGRELVTYARDAMIEEVWRLVLADIVYIPLHHQVVVWAMGAELDLPVHPLNAPRFRQARFR